MAVVDSQSMSSCDEGDGVASRSRPSRRSALLRRPRRASRVSRLSTAAVMFDADVAESTQGDKPRLRSPRASRPQLRLAASSAVVPMPTPSHKKTKARTVSESDESCSGPGSSSDSDVSNPQEDENRTIQSAGSRGTASQALRKYVDKQTKQLDPGLRQLKRFFAWIFLATAVRVFLFSDVVVVFVGCALFTVIRCAFTRNAVVARR